MSWSNEWEEYHLTPKGWVRGDSKTDGMKREERPMPKDRVLTVRQIDRMDTLTGGGVSHSSGCVELWRSPELALVKRLIKKFGDGPGM